MTLRSETEEIIKQRFPEAHRSSGSPLVYKIGRAKVSLRTASQKAGDKYWFDVTPSVYQRRKADFLAYACGSPKNVYVFPVADFERLIEGASLGGDKQVPNFTIYLDRDEFEPAGRADDRHRIAKYRNNFELIAQAS